MALIHWWPLNGDTKDYGLEPTNLTDNGATLNNSGKIGKTYDFTSVKYLSVSNPISSSTPNFSVCFWARKESTESVFMAARSGSSGKGFLLYHHDSNGLYFDDGVRLIANTSFTNNVWYHICFVRSTSPNYKKIFVNGTEVASTTTLGDFSDFLNILAIGHDNYYTNTFYGSLNDIRIYDNALSLNEIKEISKGLILHYNFNDVKIEPTTNIIGETSFTFSGFSSYGNGYTSIVDCEFGGKKVIINNRQSWCGIYKSGITVPAAGIYTFSVWCRPISRTNTSINQTLYFSGGGLNDQATVVSWDRPGEWKRISMTRTLTNTNSITLYLIAYGGSDASGYNISCEYAMPQIELSDHMTEYTPTTRSLGKVYDTSGFNNHGVSYGNPVISTTTGLHSKSCFFDGGSTAIQTPSLANLITDGIFTISSWFMHTDSWGSDGYETLYGGPGGFEIESKQGTTNSPIFSAYNWGGNGSDSYRCSYTLNEWHQWAMVRTTSGTKFYIDGKYKFAGSGAGTIPTGNYFIGAWNSFGQQNFKGYMADFKIYATALTDDDIQKEYQSRGSIDKNYNLESIDFLENDVRSSYALLEKTGVFNSKELIESNIIFNNYIFLEYIASTGTQWINSGVNVGPNIKSELTWKVDSISNTVSSWSVLYGYATSNAGNPYALWGYSGSNMIKFYRQSDNQSISLPTTKTTTVVQSNATSIDKPIYIFSIGPDAGNYSNARNPFTLYQLKIYDGEFLVRNFIPAKRKSDLAIGLYDTVEGKFYPNEGTGVFTAGPEFFYKKLEYIESTGTQFIDLGVLNKSSISVKFDCLFTQSQSTTYPVMFGSHYSGDSIKSLQIYMNPKRVDYYGQHAYSNTFALNTRYHIELLNGNFTVNGSNWANWPPVLSTDTSTYTMTLFCQKGVDAATGGGTFCKFRLYSFEMYDNGELIRKLIPAKDSNGTIGLLDTSNGTFYTNIGTGTFVAGSEIEIPRNYQRLEYLQSSGTQTIDTGYDMTTNDLIFEDTFSYAALTNGEACIGGTSGTFEFGSIGSYFFNWSTHKQLSAQGPIFPATNTKFEYKAIINSSQYICNINGVDGIPVSDITNIIGQRVYINRYYSNAHQLNGKQYLIKIYDDGNLVRHLIPARRKSDSVLGMYDLVTGNFYTNAGSGSFTAGPAVANGAFITYDDGTLIANEFIEK